MNVGIIGGTGGMGKGFAIRWCKNNQVIIRKEKYARRKRKYFEANTKAFKNVY